MGTFRLVLDGIRVHQRVYPAILGHSGFQRVQPSLQPKSLWHWCSALSIHTILIHCVDTSCFPQQDCCDTLEAAGVWKTTPKQGICFLPTGTTKCYLPDANRRTCIKQEVDLATGAGCRCAGVEAQADASMHG